MLHILSKGNVQQKSNWDNRRGAFHESGQEVSQKYEVRGLWRLAAALPLPNTISPHQLEATVQQDEIHPNRRELD
jgi:hypothetical protein